MSEALLLLGLGRPGGETGASSSTQRRRKRAGGKRVRPQSAVTRKRGQPSGGGRGRTKTPTPSRTKASDSPQKQGQRRGSTSRSSASAYGDTSLLRLASPHGHASKTASSPALRAAAAVYNGATKRARPQSATVRQRERRGGARKGQGSELQRSGSANVMPHFKLGLATSFASKASGNHATTAALRRPSFSCGPVDSPAQAMSAVRCACLLWPCHAPCSCARPLAPCASSVCTCCCDTCVVCGALL